MKNLAFVSGTLCIFLMLLYIDVFIGKDRQTFVPPPDTVAREFFKMLEIKRFSVAKRYLAAEVRQNEIEKELGVLEQKIRDTTREYQVHEGSFRFMSPDKAVSNVRLSGKGGELLPVLLLVRQKGEWKIVELPRIEPRSS